MVLSFVFVLAHPRENCLTAGSIDPLPHRSLRSQRIPFPCVTTSRHSNVRTASHPLRNPIVAKSDELTHIESNSYAKPPGGGGLRKSPNVDLYEPLASSFEPPDLLASQPHNDGTMTVLCFQQLPHSPQRCACKTALCFQQLPHCLLRNPFLLILIQTAGGWGKRMPGENFSRSYHRSPLVYPECFREGLTSPICFFPNRGEQYSFQRAFHRSER